MSPKSFCEAACCNRGLCRRVDRAGDDTEKASTRLLGLKLMLEQKHQQAITKSVDIMSAPNLNIVTGGFYWIN